MFAYFKIGGRVRVEVPMSDERQAGDDQKLVMTVGQIRELIRLAERERSPFVLGAHFTSENIVEIAKSQFPRLEAQVAMQPEMERTRRLLIVVAGLCIVAGAALIVFAPAGKEGVSYLVAAALTVLSLGAIGVQEFRFRAFGVGLEGGEVAVKQSRPVPGSKKKKRASG
jgi:hypothetical protein